MEQHTDWKVSSRSVVNQLVQTLIDEIQKGVYKANERLLSINLASRKYGVARDTVEKAYSKLKAEGYITSIAGKGYFVCSDNSKKINVLLVFNKLSYYKKLIYDNLVQAVGSKANVFIEIHHYDPAILKDILVRNAGKYHFCALMPHFGHSLGEEDYLAVIKKVPMSQLILLDKKVSQLPEHKGVYQNFDRDIYAALSSAADMFAKYKEIVLIFPEHSNHPTEVIEGITLFCNERQMGFSIATNISAMLPKKGIVYVILTESDLAQTVQLIRQSAYKLGEDVGIISFNETIFKELLDITVVTTDFRRMGQSLAEMILQNHDTVVDNPFHMIVRSSL